ncbi:MAG: alcohol dehydrogenase catalytic domain-containing protein [Pseudomonadota bacterium]
MPHLIRAAVTDPSRGVGSDPILEDLVLRALKPGEILVEMKATGICHTDFFAGSLSPGPMVPGHEGAGVISAVGPDGDKTRIGQRVALTFDSCGECPRCLDDDPAYCHSALELQFGLDKSFKRSGGDDVSGGFFKQSSFATFAIASDRNTIPIDDALPFELAAPLGCGVQTGYGAITNELRPTHKDNLLVFGLGAVGLSAISAAARLGLKDIIAVDPIAERRALALEFGAQKAFSPEEVKDGAVAPKSMAFTLDCAGVEATFHDSIHLLAPRGTMGVVAVPPPDKPISFSPLTLLDGGRKLVGIVEGGSEPNSFIPDLGRRILGGTLPLEKMMKRYAFEDFAIAWDDAKHGRTIKPVLIF